MVARAWDDYDSTNRMSGKSKSNGNGAMKTAQVRGYLTPYGPYIPEDPPKERPAKKGEVLGAPEFEGPIIYGDPKTERMLGNGTRRRKRER